MARRSRAVQFHSAGQGRRRSFARTAAALHRGHASVRLGASIFARVYALVRRIPRGRVTSYGAIARALGLPQGARTVGWALRACPDDVPWHRVVNVRGQISWRPTGGYHLQRVRLQQEGVRFTRKGRIDLERFGWGAF
jgi:methylated-DNA-protein-cysteine methyltransferase related protein